VCVRVRVHALPLPCGNNREYRLLIESGSISSTTTHQDERVRDGRVGDRLSQWQCGGGFLLLTTTLRNSTHFFRQGELLRERVDDEDDLSHLINFSVRLYNYHKH